MAKGERKEVEEKEVRPVKRPRIELQPVRVPFITQAIYIHTNDDKTISIPLSLIEQFSLLIATPGSTIEIGVSSLVVNKLIEILELMQAALTNKTLQKEIDALIANIPDEYIQELSHLGEQLRIKTFVQFQLYQRIGKFLAEQNDPNVYTIITTDNQKIYIGKMPLQLSNYLATFAQFKSEQQAEKPNELKIDADASISFPLIKLLMAEHLEQPIHIGWFDLDKIVETIELAQKWQFDEVINRTLAPLILKNIDDESFANLLTYPPMVVKFFLHAYCSADNIVRIMSIFKSVVKYLSEHDQPALKAAVSNIAACLDNINPTSILGQKTFELLSENKYIIKQLIDELDKRKETSKTRRVPSRGTIEQFEFLNDQSVSIIQEFSLNTFNIFRIYQEQLSKVATVKLPIKIDSLSPNGKYCISHRAYGTSLWGPETTYLGGIWDLLNGSKISDEIISGAYDWSSDGSKIIQGFALYAKGTYQGQPSIKLFDLEQRKIHSLRFEIPQVKKKIPCTAITFLPSTQNIVIASLFSDGTLVVATLDDKALSTGVITNYKRIAIPIALPTAPTEVYFNIFLNFKIRANEKFIMVITQKQLFVIDRDTLTVLKTFAISGYDYTIGQDYAYFVLKPNDDRQGIGILDLTTLKITEFSPNAAKEARKIAIDATGQKVAFLQEIWSQNKLETRYVWLLGLRPVLWQMKLKQLLEE